MTVVLTVSWQAQPRPVAHAPARDLSILAVQSNAPVEALYDPSVHALSFNRLALLTERGVNSPDSIDLVIWPESPLNLSLMRTPEEWFQLTNLVQRARIYLILNMIGESRGDQFYNSVAVINPNGQLMAEYRKVELLPFGEYVPLRNVLPFVDRIPALAGDFTPGGQYTVADIGKARIGSFICSESARPEIARRMTEQGATLLVEVTNDSWFGPTPAARQHLAHSIFRAVENGRHLVRVTNSGISAHITPGGDVVESTNMFEEETRRWTIPSSDTSDFKTVYTRWGDWFVLLCLGICLVGVGLTSLHRQP